MTTMVGKTLMTLMMALWMRRGAASVARPPLSCQAPLSTTTTESQPPIIHTSQKGVSLATNRLAKCGSIAGVSRSAFPNCEGMGQVLLTRPFPEAKAMTTVTC